MNELELEVFRAGDYGPRGRWSEADLDRLANAYDPALHEAPITLDHAQAGPALGWVASISRQGDRLVARMRGLSESLVTLLRDGAFKKRSVEIYRSLPESGEPYLKAVSFLGAAAPAVKGLRDAIFSEAEPLAQLDPAPADFTAFELDVTGSAEHQLGSSPRVGRPSEPTSSISHSLSPETAPPGGAGFPACDLSPDATPQSGKDAPSESFRSTSTTPGNAEHQLGCSAEPIPEAENNAPALAFADIADPLRRSGRFLPAWEERGIASFFDALASTPAFAPRPGETITPQRWFADFLSALPAAIPMGEVAPPRPQLNELNGMISSVDRASPDSLELHRRVLMLRDSQPHLSYAQALREVARH